jgi:hypothetical protein
MCLLCEVLVVGGDGWMEWSEVEWIYIVFILVWTHQTLTLPSFVVSSSLSLSHTAALPRLAVTLAAEYRNTAST